MRPSGDDATSDLAGVPAAASLATGVEESLPDPVPAPEWFTEPGFAAGLLLLAFASSSSSLQATAAAGSPSIISPSLGPSSGTPAGGPCRLNWRLLHDFPPEAHGAALWSLLGDWRKAAVLAFTVHLMMSPVLPSSSSNPSSRPLLKPEESRQNVMAGVLSGDGPVNAAPEASLVPSSGAAGAGAGPGRSSAGGWSGGPPGRGGCLRVGLSILRRQVDRCHGMEVQEACITLHELVAIPRHVLGERSAVYGLMLQVWGMD